MILSLLLEPRLLLISISQLVFWGWVAFGCLVVGGLWVLRRVANVSARKDALVAQPQWQTSYVIAFMGVCTYFIVDFFF